MRNFFSRSIAGRLRLYSLALLVPLLILGGIIVYQAWVVMPQRALDDALEMAGESSHQVDDFLDGTGKVLLAVAHLPQVKGLRAEEVASLFQELKEHYPEYENLFLADAQGQVLASAEPGAVGIRTGDRPYFQEAMATGGMTVSEVIISRRTGLPTVVAAYPVTGPQHGQYVGVIAATVDLGRLPLSLSRVRLQQEYRLTVFDWEGQMVFQAGPPGLAPDLAQCTRCHAAPAPVGDRPQRVWVRDGEFHALATTSQGWHVLVNAPSGAVLGTVQREAWGTLAFVVAILVLSLAAANFLGRRIAGPILRLAAAARRFGAGEVVEPLPVSTRDEVGALTRSFNDMVVDIGEGRRHLEERQAQLAALHALDRAVSSSLSLSAVLDTLADRVDELPAVDGVGVFLLDEGKNLTLAASRGLVSSAVAGGGGERCEAMAQQALQTKTPTVMQVLHEHCWGEAKNGRGACVAAPLSSKGQPLGAILLCTRRPQGFSPEEMDFLSTVALQVSTGVENARLYEVEHRRAAELEALTESLREHADQLQRAQEGTVETLNLTLQAKDPYTKGHADRVGLLARRMAGRLGLPPERQGLLARAARLHDIGKIGVPDRLLSKEGPLTPPERAEFQLHPERSAELLRHLPDLGQLVPAIRGHHERYDGKGYPDGLAGEEIPLEARIIAVADGYDALTTGRPYRRALSHQEAEGVLRANAGTQWDPKVVQALLDSFQEDGMLEGGQRVS